MQHQLTKKMSSETAVWGLIGTVFELNDQGITTLLKDWKSANQLIDDTKVICRAVQRIESGHMDAWVSYQTGGTRLQIANEIATVLGKSTVDTAQLVSDYDQLPIKNKGELAISGRDLMTAGVTPGPNLGKALNFLEHAVVLGELKNESATLITAALNYIN